MFQKLVQGFDSVHASAAQLGAQTGTLSIDMLSAEAQRAFAAPLGAGGSDAYLGRAFYPVEINPVVPASESAQMPVAAQQFASFQSAQHLQSQAQMQMLQGEGQTQQPGAASHNAIADMLHWMLHFMQQDVI